LHQFFTTLHHIAHLLSYADFAVELTQGIKRRWAKASLDRRDVTEAEDTGSKRKLFAATHAAVFIL
jgi:hypothetical protein